MFASLSTCSLILFLACGQALGDKQPSIIIVGAGPAGVAAATKLLENSFTNIKIFEAEDRIGGRVNSIKIEDGAYVDLGAEFCHGQENNIVYNMVKDLNVLDTRNKSYTNTLYYSNGSKINEELSTDIIGAVLDYSDFGKDEAKEQLSTKSGLSIGESFLIRYNATVLKKYENDPDSLKVAKEAIPLIEALILSNEGAFSWFQTSDEGHYEECPGNQGVTWKTHGYRLILDVLMKKFPDPSKKLPIDNKIFLEHKVEQIRWGQSNNKTFLTITPKGETPELHKADHVIFTPSVGVLRKNHANLFSPPLPQAKKETFSGIGFDGVMKIILHFKDKWWRSDDTAFTFLWTDEDLKNLAIQMVDVGPSKNGISWMGHISAVTTTSGHPNVLIAWLSGELVPEVEKTPNGQIRVGLMHVLKKFLGKSYNITEPDNMIKSKWCTNENFLGTYSYDDSKHYNTNRNYHEELAQPLVDEDGKVVVQFAGEATNPIHYSTVHGAIETGYREAQRIIDLYKTK